VLCWLPDTTDIAEDHGGKSDNAKKETAKKETTEENHCGTG